MSCQFSDIDAPMCGYAPEIQGLIDVVQDQDAAPLSRLQARAAIMRERFAIDLEVEHANYWSGGRKIPDVFGYRYDNTAGGAHDFHSMWTWLNGLQAGLEMAPA